MLEDDGVLLTWALDSPPDEAVGGAAASAVALAPHRLHYLEYEGPVASQRGRVSRWDQGTFAWLNRQPAAHEIHVSGQRLAGVITLAADADDPHRWNVMFRAD